MKTFTGLTPVEKMKIKIIINIIHIISLKILKPKKKFKRF